MSGDRGLRSLTGCVTYVLGSETPDVLRENELGQWLSGRNLGLVRTEPTDGFTWPGHFLARRRAGSWAVLFGAPPGVVFDPFGGDLAFESLAGEFDLFAFLVPYELGWSPAPAPGSGTVEGIALAGSAEAAMREVGRAEAVAGRGLRGDRYERKAGTFSDPNGRGYDLTLIESEALKELKDRGVDLPAPKARRNIVTGGISLDALIGRRFKIGPVECIGRRRCEPCAHLERLTGPGVLCGLVHRGGLRADILSGGEIRVGDEVRGL
ncbi:MOSC domain-containing protein [Rubrobacter indicoceani]|uniref:MOSC domain-containing protein n=1 Tax=Rubrobacter indicoceani TaxID=2051957 RepID=UPI0019691857|nr:MOSC domain-containing protein [Rubrobacter indicoceani]